MKIAVIGGGSMAAAIIDGMLKQESCTTDELLISVNSDASVQRWRSKGVSHVQIGASEAFAEADIWILAVKPQVMQEVLQSYQDYFSSDKLVISVAAGLTVESLAYFLNGQSATDLKIIRTMPNTPSLIGEGVIGAYASPAVSQVEQALFVEMFKACGQLDFFAEESMLDAVTGLSGSGVAYVYLFAEALIEGALALGYDASTARKHAVQTLKGASLMMEQSTDDIALLRESVTSKKGTTEQALGVFESHELKAIVAAAMKAAHDRAQELAVELAPTKH
ncbi:MAG: pyrroline-5-carboxylate reductase [Alcaligenaceae bacterium]|nr:pyrroline-5-carboxylate reductase [Alcaligenaceae bacterium]